MGQLKKMIKKLEIDYTTPYNGTIPRVSDKTYHMQKVSATEEAKLLLLSSGNNQLAKEIKDHLKVSWWTENILIYLMFVCMNIIIEKGSIWNFKILNL